MTAQLSPADRLAQLLAVEPSLAAALQQSTDRTTLEATVLRAAQQHGIELNDQDLAQVAGGGMHIPELPESASPWVQPDRRRVG